MTGRRSNAKRRLATVAGQQSVSAGPTLAELDAEMRGAIGRVRREIGRAYEPSAGADARSDLAKWLEACGDGDEPGFVGRGEA